MCSAKDWLQSPPIPCNAQRPSKISKVRLHCLIVRKRYEVTKTTTEDMELKNLKLYLENRSILEQNEQLRQKAVRLRQENIALLSEFQKKFKTSQLITDN